MGMDLIIHFSCKDLNRNSFESHAYALKRAGITNLLMVTGDYPGSGFLGLPKPVFDIDSVMAIHYVKQMNRGLEITTRRKQVALDSTDFFVGATVSPFKPTEASAVTQYRKLEKKIRAGADFIISQLGYDSRKFIELISYLRNHLELEIPVVGSVYVLSAGAARFMNQGEVPGCYVTDRLLNQVREEANSKDRGRSARIERAARQIAILKGLGYNGAHIEGLHLRFEDVRAIIGRANEIGDNWTDHLREFDYSPPDAFFLFEGGRDFELTAAGKEGGKPDLSKTPGRRLFSPVFWLSAFLHRFVFTPQTLGYRMMHRLCRAAENRKVLYRMISFLESTVKKPMFECRRCDDCALFDLFYVCPESKCPKGQRIGPCGGSRIDGRCEVFGDKLCIWEIVYWRARNRRKLDELDFIIPPRDWSLYETSSWINYFLGYDHSAAKLDIPETPGGTRVEYLP